MTSDTRFAGKLALVTGASRGIGAATAEALGAAGAHVILTARTASGLEAVEEKFHAAGGSATIAPLDLVDHDNIAKLAAAVAERWPALDILVLNAAMLGSLSPVEHLDAKELAKIFATNVFASQAMIAAFDPLLRRSDKAEVVGLTSSVGHEPRAFWGGYGASKAAFENLLSSYADETAHAGKLRVHIIDPGATRTRMRQNAFPGEEPSTLKTPDVVATAILERLGSDAETGSRVRIED
jgi:NAD(P)-dependent dehydrogenase (short-subunit alcohol dehydrogenase family)